MRALCTLALVLAFAFPAVAEAPKDVILGTWWQPSNKENSQVFEFKKDGKGEAKFGAAPKTTFTWKFTSDDTLEIMFAKNEVWTWKFEETAKDKINIKKDNRLALTYERKK